MPTSRGEQRAARGSKTRWRRFPMTVAPEDPRWRRVPRVAAYRTRRDSVGAVGSGVPTPYSASRKLGRHAARDAPFAGKAPALAPFERLKAGTQARGPPRGPYREGRAAAPPEPSPRTVRFLMKYAYLMQRTVQPTPRPCNHEVESCTPCRGSP